MSPIDEAPKPSIKRLYPHLDAIAEPPVAQTVRLLWDRVHDLEERLQQQALTTTKLISAHNTNETAIATAQTDATHALALTQSPGQVIGSPGGGGTSGGGDALPGGGDGGEGAAGCAGAGPTGHDTGGPLNPVRAGQLVCGTGNEFSALKNPVATSAERQANLEELLRRMIWHLRLGGFEAGRQQNPSGAISQDKLTVVVNGVLRAYDVFSGGPPSDPVETHMNEVAPANMVDDPGIPD